MTSALEGLKVLDVSQVAAAPMAARHLADFGADVIHVEHPVRGDSWRVYQPGITHGTQGVPSKINYNWENYNRNKRSLTLDLSQEAGQKIINKLIKNADVFITNLRMYEREKYRLEYKTLREINPRLIYASITGYGKAGPDKDYPAYDTTAYYARSGMCHMLSNEDGTPGGYRPAFGDNVAALGLFAGIMTALYTREKTGEGQEVEMSLMHTGVYQISYDVAGALVTGRDYDEWRRRRIEDIPNVLEASYKTKDGRWCRLNCVQPDNYYARVCHAIDRDDLINDPRFATFEPRIKNKVALYQILVDAFSKKTLAEWKILMIGIPFAPAQNLLEVINDPQAKANNFFITYDHPIYGEIQGVDNPIKMSSTPASIRRPAPEFNQHTEEILLEYGYTWEDISRFKEQLTIA
jgi:crotonobetainyl-CoA:carnitine CoA-transferase CaiB-like acyl-CoA transferase